MRKKYFLSVLLASVILIVVMSCVNARVNTYRTLSINKAIYENALGTVGDLYKDGLITDAKKTEILSLARKYKDAHNAAVRSFKEAVVSSQLSDKQDYLTKLSASAKILSDLIACIKPYVKKGGNK